MLRNCASIDEYLDNEWKPVLLGFKNINNSIDGLQMGQVLADISLSDSIFNYRKLLITSSDEYTSLERINSLLNNNQITESVGSHLIPSPIGYIFIVHSTLWNFDYNSYLKEHAISVEFYTDKNVKLVVEILHQTDSTTNIGELNSFEVYGLGKRNFVKEKNLKSFIASFNQFMPLFINI